MKEYKHVIVSLEPLESAHEADSQPSVRRHNN